jgi:hypothetical protein
MQETPCLSEGASRRLHLQRHNPAGHAPVDLALDDTLCLGDVPATHNGLVAYRLQSYRPISAI